MCECGVKERSGADIETGDIAHSWEPNLWMWMCSTRETVQSKREDITECNGQIRGEKRKCLWRWRRGSRGARRVMSLEVRL